MKLKIAVELDMPDEIQELIDLINSAHYRRALEDIGIRLRGLSKHSDNRFLDVDKEYDEYFSVLSDHGLSRNDIGF